MSKSLDRHTLAAQSSSILVEMQQKYGRWERIKQLTSNSIPVHLALLVRGRFKNRTLPYFYIITCIFESLALSRCETT